MIGLGYKQKITLFKMSLISFSTRSVVFCFQHIGADEQAVFLYVGAVMPWSEFNNFESITPWRLVILGILVMLVRRLPWVMLLVSGHRCNLV